MQCWPKCISSREGRVRDPRDGNWRVLRMVTLSDGETIHNAFFDRSYQDDQR